MAGIAVISKFFAMCSGTKVIAIEILIFSHLINFFGAKVIAVLIIRIFGEIVPISLGIILNALCYLLVSKLC